MPGDFRVSITNAPGKGSYPISSFTWLLVPERFQDARKGKVVADFLKWMVTEGQKFCLDLTYAPLPKAVVAMEQKAFSKVTY
jgi:phosphate transport system substrate-binding protein